MTVPLSATRARGGVVETGEQAQQRGFARAGSAHDGDELAARDGEVDAFEDLDARPIRCAAILRRPSTAIMAGGSEAAVWLGQRETSIE